MNKSLITLAGLALMVTLAGCPSSGNNPGQPSPSPSGSATATPSPGPSDSGTPSPAPSGTPTATPTPIQTPSPLPSGSALPTPDPGSATGFTVTGATATKQSDFSYIYTITGTGLGAAADYRLLQIEVGGSTKVLVSNGQIAADNIEVTGISVAAGQITLRWKNTPTSNDLVKFNYQRNNEEAKTSTAVRLSAN